MKSLSRMTVLRTGLLLIVAGCTQHSQSASTPRMGTTTTTIPSSGGNPAVVTSPAGSSSAKAPAGANAPAGTVHHVVTGVITDVDRNSGKVDIRASDGAKVQVVLPPLAVASTNKGDRASIDVIIGPAQ